MTTFSPTALTNTPNTDENPSFSQILLSLNGAVNLLTTGEITKLAKKCLGLEHQKIVGTINTSLEEKRAQIPSALKVATPIEAAIIRNCQPKIGHVINVCTSPKYVSVEDIPDHSPKNWSYGQRNLLIIYKALLKQWRTKDGMYNSNVEKSIRDIRNGKFSDRCQNNISKNTETTGETTPKLMRCNKIIPLETFLENPLATKCEHCR